MHIEREEEDKSNGEPAVAVEAEATIKEIAALDSQQPEVQQVPPTQIAQVPNPGTAFSDD